MTAFDGLLVLLALVFVAWQVYQRTVRAAFNVFSLYVATGAAGLLYRPFAFYTKAIKLGSVSLREGVEFIFLVALFYLGMYLFLLWAFPDTHLPRLGLLDYLFGGLIGLIAGALVLTLLFQGLKLAVSTQWVQIERWTFYYDLYTTSGLRSFAEGVLSLYRPLLFPFFFNGYPPILL